MKIISIRWPRSSKVLSISMGLVFTLFVWKKSVWLTPPLNPNETYLTKVGFSQLNRSDCPAAFALKAKNGDFIQKVARISVDQIVKDASGDCTQFLHQYGFTRYPPPSKEERDFPLAFIILFHKDLDQIAYLLRAIYHPHNTYCLTVDLNSGPKFVENVKKVAKCIPNVFVASKLEHIIYAGFTRLKADIHCMKDILASPIQWRYVINMAGQEFPLRTNLEMVRILHIFNGTNDVEKKAAKLPFRYERKYAYVTNNKTGLTYIKRTSEKNSAPPHGLEVFKGSAYGSFSRAFVDFVVNNPISHELQKWCSSILSPDEYFWSMLHNSKTLAVPGRYTGPLKSISAFASWAGENSCSSKRVRGVCIFTPEDLPVLLTRQELFANKFYITHHPGALHCLDQLLYNMTVSKTVRDLSYYRAMSFTIKAAS